MAEFLISVLTYQPSIMAACLYMIATLVPAYLNRVSLPAWLLILAWGLVFPLFFIVLFWVGMLSVGAVSGIGNGIESLLGPSWITTAAKAILGLGGLAAPSIAGSAATALVLTPAFGRRVAWAACWWAVGGAVLVNLGWVLHAQIVGPITFPVTIGPVTMEEPFQAETIG